MDGQVRLFPEEVSNKMGELKMRICKGPMIDLVRFGL